MEVHRGLTEFTWREKGAQGNASPLHPTFNPTCPRTASHKKRSRCKVPRRYPGNRLSHPTHRQRRQRWDPTITNSGIWEQSKWNQRKAGLQTCDSDFTVSLLGPPNSASPNHIFLDHLRLPRVSCVSSSSHVQLFATLRTVARQALLSMEFSRQYWSGQPFPSLRIKPGSPANGFFTTELPGEPTDGLPN